MIDAALVGLVGIAGRLVRPRGIALGRHDRDDVGEQLVALVLGRRRMRDHGSSRAAAGRGALRGKMAAAAARRERESASQ